MEDAGTYARMIARMAFCSRNQMQGEIPTYARARSRRSLESALRELEAVLTGVAVSERLATRTARRVESRPITRRSAMPHEKAKTGWLARRREKRRIKRERSAERALQELREGLPKQGGGAPRGAHKRPDQYSP